jgi:hypothetical protein
LLDVQPDRDSAFSAWSPELSPFATGAACVAIQPHLRADAADAAVARDTLHNVHSLLRQSSPRRNERKAQEGVREMQHYPAAEGSDRDVDASSPAKVVELKEQNDWARLQETERDDGQSKCDSIPALDGANRGRHLWLSPRPVLGQGRPAPSDWRQREPDSKLAPLVWRKDQAEADEDESADWWYEQSDGSLLSWPGALDGEAAALSLARLELHKIMEASLIYLEYHLSHNPPRHAVKHAHLHMHTHARVQPLPTQSILKTESTPNTLALSESDALSPFGRTHWAKQIPGHRFRCMSRFVPWAHTFPQCISAAKSIGLVSVQGSGFGL